MKLLIESNSYLSVISNFTQDTPWIKIFPWTRHRRAAVVLGLLKPELILIGFVGMVLFYWRLV